MLYCLQLQNHPNIRYQESSKKLGKAELYCILAKCGIHPAAIDEKKYCNSTFLTFNADELNEDALKSLYSHSSAALICEDHGGMLLPLPYFSPDYLPKDLPEILKYKGKTNSSFTKMMINIALSCSDTSPQAPEKITVLDPLCGKGTTLFCAAQMGYNAVGIDTDRQSLNEAVTFFGKYLEYYRIKHKFEQSSVTAYGKGVPEAKYTFADTKEHYLQKETRHLTFYQGDTGCIDKIMQKSKADLIIADLPYGIQHAPQNGVRVEGFVPMLNRVLPAWRCSMKDSGAIAVSFNTLTLPRSTVVKLMEDAGFHVVESISGLEHRVEQAVERDFVVSLK